MRLSDCKVELSWPWIKNCVLLSGGEKINNDGADANAGN